MTYFSGQVLSWLCPACLGLNCAAFILVVIVGSGYMHAGYAFQ
jgi:hypothetical protein